MKTQELDSKYYFNYLAAYQHTEMGLSLVLHPHLSLPLFPRSIGVSACRCACPILLVK